jgi:hypothetical protein
VDGFAVVIFDNRNPAWQPRGKGYIAFQQVQQSLRDRNKLQRCSWQDILVALRQESSLAWLTQELALKYGL